MSAGDEVERARGFAGVGRFAEAAGLLATHLARHPDDVAALTLMAWVQNALRRPDLAWGAAQQAIALAPSEPSPLVVLADTLTRLSRVPDARAALDRARELAPGDPDVIAAWIQGHLGVGPIGNWGRRRRLLAAARQLVEIAPESAESHRMMGLVRADLSQPRRADAAFRIARSLAPVDHTIANDHAGVAITMNRFGDAMATFVDRLATAPDSELALFNLRATIVAFLRIYWFILFGAAYLSVRVLGAMPPDQHRVANVVILALVWLVGLGVLAHTVRTAGSAFPTVVRTLVHVDRVLAALAVALAVTLLSTTVHVLWPSPAAGAFCVLGYLTSFGLVVTTWLTLGRARASLDAEGAR